MGIDKKLYFFGQTSMDGVDHIPLVTTHFINPNIELSSYEYIIITSKRSIEAMLAFKYNFKNIPIYCIGEKTAKYAKKKGLNVLHTSVGYAKDLISEIRPLIKNKRGIYLRPKKVANSYITQEIDTGLMEEAICYETRCIEKSNKQIEQPAILLFAAPSQVNCFRNHFSFHTDDWIVCIGTTTAKAFSKDQKVYLSDEPSLKALVKKGKELGAV